MTTAMAELEQRYADEDINALRKLVLDKYGLTRDSTTGKYSEYFRRCFSNLRSRIHRDLEERLNEGGKRCFILACLLVL